MKKIFFLLVCALTINVSCQKKNAANHVSKPIIDTLYESPESLYFDNDNLKDKAEIKAKQKIELSTFVLSLYLSSLKKNIEIPVLNNSILYNNTEAEYYLSDPIIKDKIVELRIEYADQITKPNISGERKNLIEKLKFRFNSENNKIQIIGYDISYSKENKSKYIKSFNFLTGKYNSSCFFNNKKKETSGWTSELQNIYTENWDRSFINKLSSYGNEIE